MEDYLEAIYHIEREKRVARVSDIGTHMNVRKASVVSAVTLLKAHELLSQERYGFITLTDAGRKRAERISKKNNTILSFLKDVLKVEEQAAKLEAREISHSLSDDTVGKLGTFLKGMVQGVKAQGVKPKQKIAVKKG